MPISSMTGFSRVSREDGDLRCQWDLRSVNGKTLDVRFRLPPGLEHLEAAARQIIARQFKRGNIQATLNVETMDRSSGIVVNEKALEQAISASQRIRKLLGGGPVQAETLLTIRGVIESQAHSLSEDAASARDAALLESLAEAATDLAAMRQSEGDALAQVLLAAIKKIEDLTTEAAANPSRKPDVIRLRLKDQIDRLLETSANFDVGRLHQEAMLLSVRSDIQEEIDRLSAHAGAARKLLVSDEPVGRKFDFLTQEFNREANTLCSKSADIALTNTGLELKNVIDQLREQVQNIE